MGKKAKVVFDTNVWVSIFMKKTLSRDFSKILNKKAAVYTTEEIMTEISRVLMYPKISEILQHSNIHARTILRAITTNSTMVKPRVKIQVIEEDPEDNKILECANEAGANIIVTGDKHLLKLGKFKKTIIPTPRQFLDNFS